MTTLPFPTNAPNRLIPSTATTPSWVPVDACQLPTGDVPMRIAALEDLFATAVKAIERAEPTRLRLTLAPDPAVAARAAELGAREADCCGFFTFTLTATTGHLTLDVTVPEARTVVLDGLAAQAAEAKTRS